MIFSQAFGTDDDAFINPIDKAPQTNPALQPRSEPALELHSKAASNVDITSPLQWSQHRKQFMRRKAEKNDKNIISNKHKIRPF